ncbi:MAG: hypothetical protein IPI20_20240 [Rhodoferax sp.]|nr:hypothetical protein [Rhodoferax sp.]
MDQLAQRGIGFCVRALLCCCLTEAAQNQHEAFIAVPYSALVVAVFGGVVHFFSILGWAHFHVLAMPW